MAEENKSIWYGPHACSVCGVTIVKAAREDGGAEYEPPARLLEIYRRGAQNGDVDLVYPMTWTPHVHIAAQTPATSEPSDAGRNGVVPSRGDSGQ